MNNHSNNVDVNEIAHFATLADTWWDKTGPLRTLHDINPTRLAFVQKYTALENKTVLDVGCGGGIFSEALTQAGAIVTGIDQELNAINAAQKHVANQIFQDRCQYQCINLEDLDTQQYDIITCMEMLEHVPHPEQIIQNCVRLLKPNGKLFLSTINRTWKAYCFAILGAEYILKLLPKQTHHYDRFIRPSEMAEWLRKTDLSITAFSGLDYNPFTHHATLTPDLAINYLAVAQIRTP